MSLAEPIAAAMASADPRQAMLDLALQLVRAGWRQRELYLALLEHAPTYRNQTGSATAMEAALSSVYGDPSGGGLFPGSSLGDTGCAG